MAGPVLIQLIDYLKNIMFFDIFLKFIFKIKCADT